MEILSNAWKKVNNICDWEISGYSIGGIRTSFYIKDLNILLDAGFQCFSHPSHIFITHLHADHIGNLHLTILENINNNSNTTIICPKESINFLKKFLESFLECNYHSERFPKNNVTFIGMSDGDIIELKLKKANYLIEAYKTDHVVPTLCYGFIQKTTKLKNEYLKLQGQEIKKLRENGENIFYINFKKKLLFCGDTSYKFLDNKKIYNYENIMIECTYFEMDEIETSKERKHMHWIYLSSKIKQFTDINFYVIHISPKHRLINNTIEIPKNGFLLTF